MYIIPEPPYSNPMITLCGRSRYQDEEIELTKKLTDAGWTVLHIEYPYYQSLKTGAGFNYRNIFEMNRSRIRVSEMLYVIRKDGNKLDSVIKWAIEYAESINKPIHYMDI